MSGIEIMSSYRKSKSLNRSSSINKTILFGRSKSFNRSTLSPLNGGSPKALSAASPRPNRLSCVSQWSRMLIVIGLFVSFIIFFAGGYIYVLPSLSPEFLGYSLSVFNNSMVGCDIFNGSWVLDDAYPLYNASECPFAEQGFNCLGNGRSDNDYLKWRWKPKHCDLPRFDVYSILERFRNKRIVFVGDSMSRTQWESLICLLMTGVEDKKSVYEVNGNNITKRIRFLGVRFSSFNFTIEFFRSVFLVQHGLIPRHAPRRVTSTLKLDKLDNISNEWLHADILIFNTGQWWVPGKLFQVGCYFQVGNSLKLGMSIRTAFRLALGTWAAWVERSIDTNKTRVFFRTFEPSHWSDQSHRLCNVTQNPMTEPNGREHHVFSDSVLEVIKNVKIPITVLNITSLSSFRSDAHVGQWNDNQSAPDCAHWCLPGVPDVWNEIFFSCLFHDCGLHLQ